METFVIARCHRVARGADVAMMDQQMLGPEMGIEDHREKEIAQPTFRSGFLVHQFVAVVDPDRA